MSTTLAIRTLPSWPHPETPERLSSGTFRAPWDDTVRMLRSEADWLNAQEPIVLQLVCDPTAIRRDGMLRARAHIHHPGVIVTLATHERGPLVFATDVYDQTYAAAMPGWQANVRAVALGLKALRAVDRYGITRRGEQYAGFRELTAGPASSNGFASADTALRWVREQIGLRPDGFTLTLPTQADRTVVRSVIRQAQRQLHPDAGGAREQWDRLEQARQLLTTEGYL